MKITRGIEGEWHTIKGIIKTKWGKFTDDELKEVEGKKEKLVGLLMKKYGMSKYDAKHEVSKFWH